MKKTLIQTMPMGSMEWTPLIASKSKSKKDMLNTIFDNYLSISVSPDCTLIAILEDKKFILINVDNNIHDLNTINEVLLEDDTMSRSTRRFSWSHDSKLFVFTSSDAYGNVRLIGFNRKGHCILTPTVLESFIPYSAITIADIIFHNYGRNSINNTINLSSYNIYIFTKNQTVRQFVLEISGFVSDEDDFASSSSATVETFKEKNLFLHDDDDNFIIEQSLNGMYAGETVCKVDVVSNSNLIIMSSIIQRNNNNINNSIEGSSVYQSNLSSWSIDRETNLFTLIAITSVPLNNDNDNVQESIFSKDFYSNNIYATNEKLEQKMNNYLKRNESVCTQIQSSIMSLFFASKKNILTSYNTRYGIHTLKILKDDNNDIDHGDDKKDRNNGHSFYVGTIDFSGNVHIFRFNDNNNNNDFTHVASIYATKTKYFTNFAWWSRSNNLILLITNLGVIDVYDFKTCQSMLWEQSHVTAGHRKLFSMDLGYAGILSRQKSIETGVFSYNQLQRVNEYSLLETLVRKKNIDKATQLAIDFNIPMDAVYKSRWKNKLERYTISDVDKILKPIQDFDWVIENSYNYFEDDNSDVISALINHCLEIINIEGLKSVPKYVINSNDNQGDVQNDNNIETNEGKATNHRKVPLSSSSSSSSDDDDDNSKDGWSDDDDDWSDNDDSDSDSSETNSEAENKESNNVSSDVINSTATKNKKNNEENQKHFDRLNECMKDKKTCKLLEKRLTFLKYKYRLRCFLHLKAMEENHNDNQAKVHRALKWKFFRDCNLVDFAILNCSDGRFDIVSKLFQYCWEELYLHRMSILSNIPDTCPVSEYSMLLPYCSSDVYDNETIASSFTAIPLYIYRDNKSGKVTAIEINTQFEKDLYDDWIMNEFVMQMLNQHDTIEKEVSNWAVMFFKAHNVATIESTTHQYSPNALATWYAKRAYAMENRSGQLSNALELCVLGLDLFDNSDVNFDTLSDKIYEAFSSHDASESEKDFELISNNDQEANVGFENLTRIYIILSSLEKLVYDTNSIELETTLSTLTLETWLEIPNAKKVELIMRSATPEHAVGRVKRILFMWMGNRKNFVSTCERKWVELLIKYMEEVASNFNGFKICVAILKSCDLRDSTNAIIREPPVLISICLHCIYACPLRLLREGNRDDDEIRHKEINNDLFNDMNDIFNMIPIITEKMVEEFPTIVELDKKVDRLKSHLDAIEVLRIYNIAPEIAFFNSCEEEYQKTNDGTNVSTRNLVKGKEILNNICRKFISNPQNSTTRESIIRLIEDLDYICTAIPGISKEYTNEILLKHSLGSRFYNVGKTIMENNILPPNVVEEIVIAAAIDYYNSAAGSHDQIMETAKEILNLAPLLNDDVLNELHLIEASRLVASLGSSMLPLQIRLIENKIDVINRVLQDNPRNYLNVSSIQKLLFLLIPRASMTKKKQVQMFLIKTAIREGDFIIAANYFITLFQMLQKGDLDKSKNKEQKEQHDENSSYLDSVTVKEAIELIKNKNFTDTNGKNKLMNGLFLNSSPDMLTELVDVWKHFHCGNRMDMNTEESKDEQEINLFNISDNFQVSKFWHESSLHDNFDNRQSYSQNIVGSVNPIGFMLENDNASSSTMPFNESNEVQKAIASALDYIESDDRYRFMLSFTLALIKIKNNPDEVEKYYDELLSGCKTSESKEKILAIACSVFCMESLFCTKTADKYAGNFNFFHLPYISLYEQLKSVQPEQEVESSKLDKFKRCKATATQLAGKIIQGSGGDKDVVGQYMLTHDYMKSLPPEKLVEFIKKLTVSQEDGAVGHPLGVRCAAVDAAVRLLSKGTNEYKIVQKLRCRLKAIEEIQAAVAMSEYPLLQECLQDRANELERTQSPTQVKECFLKMASSGVPPILLTRVVMAYAGKLTNDSTTDLTGRGFKIPKKIIDFYRVGITVLLKSIKSKHISMKEREVAEPRHSVIIDDALHTMRYDLYLILYHLKEDNDANKSKNNSTSNNPVKDVVVNALMKYCKKEDTTPSEACIILESFVLANVVSMDRLLLNVDDDDDEKKNDDFDTIHKSIFTIISKLYEKQFMELNNYGRLFIVNSMCQIKTHEEIGYHLLKFHFVHDALQSDDAAIQISQKYMQNYKIFSEF